MGAAALLTDAGTTLAEQCRAYIKANNLTRAAFARLLTGNWSRAAVTSYINGTYNSNPANIEMALRRFFTGDGETGSRTQQPTRLIAAYGPDERADFIQSGDARSVFGVCRACQEDQLIGVVTGQSGYGKTYSLKQYAKLPRVSYVASNPYWGPRTMVKRIELALGVTPKTGNVDDHIQIIIEYLTANPGYLLIIDEADKLISKYTTQKLYILQAIYDAAPVGIILAGLPKLETLLTYLPELENRATYGCKLRGLSPQEVDEYLSRHDITPDVREQLHARAYGRQKGCFRLLAHTVNAVIKDRNENHQGAVTMDIYNRATANMVIR